MQEGGVENSFRIRGGDGFSREFEIERLYRRRRCH